MSIPWLQSPSLSALTVLGKEKIRRIPEAFLHDSSIYDVADGIATSDSGSEVDCNDRNEEQEIVAPYETTHPQKRIEKSSVGISKDSPSRSLAELNRPGRRK